jgi:hypothetical protein
LTEKAPYNSANCPFLPIEQRIIGCAARGSFRRSTEFFPSIKGRMRVLLGFRGFAEGKKLKALELDFAN